MGKYTEAAERYAQSIVSGKTPASQAVKDIYNHWIGYKKAGYFNTTERFEGICSTIEDLPMPHGKEGAKFKLLDWQCGLISLLFGFSHDGVRRLVRELHLVTGRKSGQSTLAAAILLARLVERDSPPFPNLLILGSNVDSAELEFSFVRGFMEKDKELGGDFAKKHNLRFSKKRVYQKGRAYGGIEWATPKRKDLEGSTFEAVLFTDLARFESAEALNVIRSGTLHSNEALILSCSTPSDLPHSALDSMLVRKILGDTGVFCLHYGADKEDDFADPKTWEKAQPSLGTIVDSKWIKDMLKQGQQFERDMYAFKTRILAIPAIPA